MIAKEVGLRTDLEVVVKGCTINVASDRPKRVIVISKGVALELKTSKVPWK